VNFDSAGPNDKPLAFFVGTKLELTGASVPLYNTTRDIIHIQ